MRSKLIAPKARLIRFPFDLRGKRYIDFGLGLTTGVGCRIEAFSDDGQKTMKFGRNVQLNDYVHISSMKQVVIGDNVLIAGKVYISDNAHGYYGGTREDTSPDIIPIERKYDISSVIIEENTWIGENVVVLPNTVIGRGSVIGANSVVKGYIPPYSIAVGAIAKVIKKYNFETQKWEKIN